MSPRIPTYESQGTLPEKTGAVPVPVGPAVLPYEAAARGFDQATNITSTLDAHITHAEHAAQVSKATAQAMIQAAQFRDSVLSSPEFNADPQATQQYFQEGLGKIGKSIADTIPSSQAKAVFQQHFNSFTGTHVSQFINDARMKRIQNLQGSTLEVVDASMLSASKARSPEEFKKALVNGYAAIADAEGSGALHGEHAVKLREHMKVTAQTGLAANMAISDPLGLIRDLQSGEGIFRDMPELNRAHLLEHTENKIDRMLAKQEQELTPAAKNYAWSYVRGMFHLDDPKAGPDDYDLAARWSQNPANWKEMGVDIAKDPMAIVQHITSSIDAEKHQTLQNRDRAERQQIANWNLGLIDKWVKGELKTEDIYNSPGIPVNDHTNAIKSQWDNARTALQTEEDKQRTEGARADLTYAAMTGELDDIEKALPFVQHGVLNAAQLKDLNHTIQSAQDPANSRWLKLVDQHYKDVFGKDDKHLTDFMVMFDEYLKNPKDGKKLTGKAIYDAADEFMQPGRDRKWYEWLGGATGWKPEETKSPFQRAWEGTYGKLPSERKPPLVTPGNSQNTHSAGQVDQKSIQAMIDNMRAKGDPDEKIKAFFLNSEATKNLNPADFGLK